MVSDDKGYGLAVLLVCPLCVGARVGDTPDWAPLRPWYAVICSGGFVHRGVIV
jgi:hypothetical protein